MKAGLFPLAVLLAAPFGVFGTVLAVSLRGLENNIYFQIALLTSIGLAARNAILMVEFADNLHKNGVPLAQAALAALGGCSLAPAYKTPNMPVAQT